MAGAGAAHAQSNQFSGYGLDRTTLTPPPPLPPPGGRRSDSKAREDFEDLRLTLQETDYGNFLAAEPALDPKLIGARCTAKWVGEFKYFRATATGELAKFMDYVAYEYMIDNILDLIKAATSASSVNMEAVVENCHPLGLLSPSIMKSILAFEDLGEDFASLYRTVLVDTPVGRYFTQFLADIADERAAADPEHVRATFAEIPMTIIENAIKKFYLEDFYYFCEGIGGETGALMCELLGARADMLTISITYNSLTGGGGRGSTRAATRASLYPAVGKLYPGGSDLLAHVEDEDALRRGLERAYPAYAVLWDSAPVDSRGLRDLSDACFRASVKSLELAFEGQFHAAPLYAYAKLKEQEVKNIQWLATCLEHRQYGEMER